MVTSLLRTVEPLSPNVGDSTTMQNTWREFYFADTLDDSGAKVSAPNNSYVGTSIYLHRALWQLRAPACAPKLWPLGQAARRRVRKALRCIIASIAVCDHTCMQCLLWL